MTPPRRDPLEEARRRLNEAAGALDGMRRLTGAPAAPEAPAGSASEGVRREALAAAREDLRRMAADLEAARARAATLLEEMGRLRGELAARPTARELEEARAASESDAVRRAAELAAQVVGLKERLALLSAEHVRLETLRRKAEASGADSEASRRSLEETLRRDLRATHASLDRAAAESGTREAKAVTEIEEMRKRLDQALNRLHREDMACKLEEARAAGESQATRRATELTQQVAELKERLALLSAEHVRLEALRRKTEASGADSEASRRSLEETLRRDLRDAHTAFDRAAAESGTRFEAAQAVIASLRRELSEAQSPPLPPAGGELGDGEEVGVEYPALEYALEPGWAKLLGLVKPPLQAAYGHLRRLSAGPMSAGQRAILRLTGSSLSAAADSLATIELALADSPATSEAASVLPILESALAAWEAVFRRRGIVLARELTSTVPDSSYDPEQLRLALHHVLRNAVEALARGATLRVHLRKSATDVAELEFRDDGPGYPLAWLERQFEPFASPRPGHAGLGLAAVRRALRRWGGDAVAINSTDGRGACLTLTFAPAPARPEAK